MVTKTVETSVFRERLSGVVGPWGLTPPDPKTYVAGERIALHRHDCPQLLYARQGVLIAAVDKARWMVPAGHALWIPEGAEHAVEMLVNVDLISLHVAPDVIPHMPVQARVVEVSSLARELILAALEAGPAGIASNRMDLVMPLLLDVLSALPERELGLPFPRDPRLATLCRDFVKKPTADLAIDEWARTLSMSRRSFTRFFRRETGLSLSLWRQQACLFSALPRLADGEAVTSIALDLGYDSIAAFTTMFKRMMGAPPRAYVGARKSAA
ncbi:AraC family transcriptional regulator [Agrobacterium sp. ES01]|uniref:AraC family transcriptional regulator n=1 Tax=Agrobacterium sp. ES01 TaxID=3420714 RepID=UPI003D0FFCF7